MPALFLVDPTPDTIGYLIAGYVFMIGLPVLYIASWFVRQRSLQRDIETIESLETDEVKRAAQPRAAGPADLKPKAGKPSAP